MEPPEAVEKAGFSKSLDDADERIRNAYPLVRAEWCARHPTLDLRCDYTYRGPRLQMDLFKKGRALDAATGQWVLVDRSLKVTDKDGTINKGPHNYYPAKGTDVYICEVGDGGKILWPLQKEHPEFAERESLYLELGRLWEKHGLVSGATWKYAWKDLPHVQTA